MELQPKMPLFVWIYCCVVFVGLIHCQGILSPVCDVSGWTDWLNADDPYTGFMDGDYDVIPTLRQVFRFCSNHMIVDVECRDTITRQPPEIFHQVVECSTDTGLRCSNADQLAGDTCLDYEVRFFCDCEMTTTAIVPSEMPTSEIVPSEMRTTEIIPSEMSTTEIIPSDSTCGNAEFKGKSFIFKAYPGSFVYHSLSGVSDSSQFTLCMWLRINDLSRLGTVVHYSTPMEVNEIMIAVGKIQHGTGVSLIVSQNLEMTRQVPFNLNQWQHVCLAWKSQGSSGILSIFENYNNIYTMSLPISGVTISGTGLLILGQRNNGFLMFDPSYSFSGEIAFLNVWSHALNEDEIQSMASDCMSGCGDLISWADIVNSELHNVDIGSDFQYCELSTPATTRSAIQLPSNISYPDIQATERSTTELRHTAVASSNLSPSEKPTSQPQHTTDVPLNTLTWESHGASTDISTNVYSTPYIPGSTAKEYTNTLEHTGKSSRVALTTASPSYIPSTKASSSQSSSRPTLIADISTSVDLTSPVMGGTLDEMLTEGTNTLKHTGKSSTVALTTTTSPSGIHSTKSDSSKASTPTIHIPDISIRVDSTPLKSTEGMVRTLGPTTGHTTTGKSVATTNSKTTIVTETDTQPDQVTEDSRHHTLSTTLPLPITPPRLTGRMSSQTQAEYSESHFPSIYETTTQLLELITSQTALQDDPSSTSNSATPSLLTEVQSSQNQVSTPDSYQTTEFPHTMPAKEHTPSLERSTELVTTKRPTLLTTRSSETSTIQLTKKENIVTSVTESQSIKLTTQITGKERSTLLQTISTMISHIPRPGESEQIEKESNGGNSIGMIILALVVTGLLIGAAVIVSYYAHKEWKSRNHSSLYMVN